MAGQYDLPYTGPQVESLLAKVTELESEMPTKTSDLTNDSGFITAAAVPTKTSDLTNDSGFITNAPVAAEAARAQAAEALLATIASLQAEITRATGVEGTLQGLIDGITAKIPSAATAQNQLADKNFVNSSISTSTAEFKGTYNSLSELQAVTANENDYGFVVSTDAAGNTVYSRYKYSGGSWRFEYDLNNSSFTAAQWAAINSAVTAELVAKLSALPDNATLTAALAAKQDVIDDLSSIRSKANSAYQKPSGGIPKTDLASAVQTSLGKADSAIQDVSDKADKDTDAVEGNVAQFDANGNPVDGGVPVENIAQKDGYYGGMTVGAAENLVGRGVVEAEYVDRRTSAGSADIGSGSASIRKIMGRSVKFNQQFDYSETTISGNFCILYSRGGKFIAQHKFLLKFRITTDSEFTGNVITLYLSSSGSTYGGSKNKTVSANQSILISEILTSNDSRNKDLVVRAYNAGDIDHITVDTASIMVIDLTSIFGSGNEPATVEDFEEWLAQNVGTRDYYPYTEPTILNNAADGIKTRGFNLYNPATGKAYLPGKYSDYPHEYEICGTFSSISYTDINGNTYVPELTDGKFFNVDAPGELTVVGGNNTDTLVHLVWSGWRNEGEPDYAYEAYWENTLALNLTTLTGKLNGEGESVVIAPNGLAKVGSVMDYGIVENGMLTKIVKCLGVVDMGTLTWNYTQESFRSSGVSSTIKTVVTSAVPNIVNVRYEASKRNAQPDKCIGVTTTGNLVVNDFSYSAAADFKTSVTGVLLYYELATPQVYVLDEPIAMNYRVDDFGTEETVPAYDPQRLIAPLAYDVQYAMNAVDVIRRLPDNYVERADVKQTPGTSEKHILSQKGVEDNYAHKVGTEDNLTVGAAKNIVGNATSGGYPFTFVRISGTDGLARINSVKGNSVVWNQLISDESMHLVGTGVSSYKQLGSRFQIVSGHKYLVKLSNWTNINTVRKRYPTVGSNWVSDTIFTSTETDDSCGLQWLAQEGVSVDTYVNVFNLTLMFGAGNEPSTVEEFEALYPLPYYSYNAGTILSNKTEQVKVVGFNQWDEEWEAGGIDSQGRKVNYNDRGRSKNYIPIFPSTSYYFKTKTGITQGDVFFYDANKVFVSALFNRGNSSFTTPAGCAFMLFAALQNYGTTYNHDICINLSDPSLNGTYEPYKTNTIEFNLPTLTGKVNGEGESVVIAPDGLRGAGTVYDEGIVDGGYLTRIRRTFGSYTFTGNESVQKQSISGRWVFSNILEGCGPTLSPIICDKFADVTIANGSSYPQAATFSGDIGADSEAAKQAVAGATVHYALAEPVTYVLDTPIPATFQSYKGGTLQQLPENTATPVTAPCAFSVTYAIDAAGILTGLPKDYLNVASLDNLLATLGSALNGTITKAWNDEQQRYTFTFTPSEQ